MFDSPAVVAPPLSPLPSVPSAARALSAVAHPAPPDAAVRTRRLPQRDLEAQLRSTAAELAAGTYRFLVLVAEFDRRESHTEWECRTTADWLSWQCGVGPTAAREQVRVARRLHALPLISAAFAEGRISYSKVRALTRVAEASSEADLLEVAGAATAGQLERICAALRRHGGAAADEHAAEAEEAASAARASVDWYRTADGEVVGTFRLPAESGERFVRAITAAADALPPDVSPDERRAAAFDHLVTTPPDPAERARPEIVVHVDLAALGRLAADAPPDGRPQRLEDLAVVARTDGGAQVSARAVARLMSDAAVRFVTTAPHGEQLDLGRSRRTVPPRMFRSLAARDRHCRFPGCSSTARLHAHHIRWWSHGGRTDRENLLLLCAKHHHAVHDRGWTCSGNASAPRFARPDGTAATCTVRSPAASAEALCRANRRGGGQIAESPGGRWTGEPIDWVCLFAAFAHHLPLRSLNALSVPTAPAAAVPTSTATTGHGVR